VTGPDPFGTAALRASVLASWADSPTRFREDANAEEDLLLGGYGDRWLVELAQNAADAAGRAGVPGRLWVRLDGSELRVANTGAPLDVEGVTALAALRASAKRDSEVEVVGRFGVGFAAVLPVSAEPSIVSRGGGVAFSASRTATEVAALAGPAAELARREGQLPVLRLVWPTPAGETPPEGYDTEVRLPLRPEVDGERLLSDALASAADLLLALPALIEVRIGSTCLARRDDADGTVLIDGGPQGSQRWLLVRSSGVHAAAVLAGTAVEQRDRTEWTVSWALPLAGDDPVDREPAPLIGEVLHAPTPSNERLSLPARLFAAMPMEPSRRRFRPGPLADAVLAAAGEAYVSLLRSLPAERRRALIPAPGFPASELDGLLREAVAIALRDAKWLPAAGGGELAPSDAVLLDLPGAELPELLADVVPGLLADGAGAPTSLVALGVQRLGASELTERLAGLERPPAWWREVYQALAPAADVVPGLTEELAALPVPLVDGRVVTGPASAVFADDAPESRNSPVGNAQLAGAERATRGRVLGGLGLPGLRVVHPDAMHPLLARLGAQPAGPAELLDHPAVGEAVARSVDDAEAGLDTAPLAAAVLALVDELGATGRPWLGALALPDTEGQTWRADELMLPDAAIRPLLDADSPVAVLADEVAATVDRTALTAVGVLDGFAVLTDEQPTGPDHELADEERWWAEVTTDGEPPHQLTAVRDLDLVADHAWPQALAVLAADPATRAAVRHRAGEPPPYTAWWLSQYARLGGRRPGYWRLRSAVALAGLFDEVPAEAAGLDEEFLAAIGVRAQVSVTGPTQAADLLARLADAQRVLDAGAVAAAHAALAQAVLTERLDPDAVEPPDRVRSESGTELDAADAVVLDLPWLAAALPGDQLVSGGDPVALAELLDLPLASEGVRAAVASTGRSIRWSELAEVVRACASIGVTVPAGELFVHDRLEIELQTPAAQRLTVPVWRDEQGSWHADDPVRALLAYLATPRTNGTFGR